MFLLYNSKKFSGGFIYFMRTKFLLSLLILHIMSYGVLAASPTIITNNEPHVGEQVILAVNNSDIPTNGSVEWSITPTTGLNPARIALRSGGRECTFIPLDTKPIRVTATVSDRNGNPVGNSEYIVNPKEFIIEISVVVDDSNQLTLWDSSKRSNYVLASNVHVADSPIKLRAQLKPEFKGEHTLKWILDASTELLNQNGDDISILRSQIGESEISVTAFNSSGVKLGSGEGTVKISLPVSAFEDSAREREAWQSWLKAQELWEAQNYSEAVEFGNRAITLSPRDTDINNGLKAMTLNYSRYTRAQKLREDAIALNAKGSYDDALKNLRAAQVIWPIDRGEADIQEAERKVDEQRVLLQQATWLRDTASAYDNEQMFEDALDYYARSVALISNDAITSRMEKIRARLVKIADADKYAGEGSRLEREGNLQEALSHYTASVLSNPDAGLRQHIDEIQNVLSRRERQAKTLSNEGRQLERKNPQEALKRYKESLILWDDGRVEQTVKQLERNVRLDDGVVLRGPEDFGIGTKNDATRLIQEADNLYSTGKIKEAIDLYRKAQSISSNPEIKDWLSRVEATEKERESIETANALIKQANALYKAGNIKEAMDLYKKSLAAHSNPQVEKFINANQSN